MQMQACNNFFFFLSFFVKLAKRGTFIFIQICLFPLTQISHYFLSIFNFYSHSRQIIKRLKRKIAFRKTSSSEYHSQLCQLSKNIIFYFIRSVFFPTLLDSFCKLILIIYNKILFIKKHKQKFIALLNNIV